MIVTSVDTYPLAMPVIRDAADGTQDTLLVRVRTDTGVEGWGECDSSPLVCLAAYCCPMSHSNIVGIRESLVGETLESVDDVARLHRKVMRRGLDIEHIHHAYSGADVALWDALGKHLQQPVYRLLEDGPPCPKLPYASVLFGDTPDETRSVAESLRADGYRAAKFGWGPMGRYGAEFDVGLVAAARQGMGPDAEIMIDAGVAWDDDYATAYRRAESFAEYEPTWLEEPLAPDAVAEYGMLTDMSPPVPIAAGEGSNSVRAAQDLIQNGRVDFVQIDVGRIGGISAAREVLGLAGSAGVTYVNHTFKSHVSLAASLAVFASTQSARYLEYPADGADLARRLVRNRLERGDDGLVAPHDAPGLGVEVDMDTVREYFRPARIEMAGEVLADVRAPEA